MPSILPVVSAHPAAYDTATVNNRANKALPVEAPTREKDLARQLDEQISGRLARIRNRISAEGEGSASLTDGNGTLVDILA